jgi:WD40 repeat protein
VFLWDVRTGKEVLVRHAHAARVWALAFSPDGRRLASGGGDTAVRVHEVPAPPE